MIDINDYKMKSLLSIRNNNLLNLACTGQKCWSCSNGSISRRDG